MTTPAYLHDGSWEPTSEQRELVARAFAAFGFIPAVSASKGRRKAVARARHAACWAIRARWGAEVSLPMIAAMVGRRDHSTAHNSLRQAEALRAADEHYRAVTDAIVAGLPPPPAPPAPPAEARAAQPRHGKPVRLRKVRARNDFGPDDRDGERRAVGSDRLLAALRREHPERCAA